jgi:hypothetical protein
MKKAVIIIAMIILGLYGLAGSDDHMDTWPTKEQRAEVISRW